MTSVVMSHHKDHQQLHLTLASSKIDSFLLPPPRPPPPPPPPLPLPPLPFDGRVSPLPAELMVWLLLLLRRCLLPKVASGNTACLLHGRRAVRGLCLCVRMAHDAYAPGRPGRLAFDRPSMSRFLSLHHFSRRSPLTFFSNHSAPKMRCGPSP